MRSVPAKTLLAILLFSFCQIDCKYFRDPPQYESETADASPVKTADSGDIFLNNEPYGSLEDLSVIGGRVREIMRLRGVNGVFEEGTNEIVGRINIFPTATMSIGKVGELFRLLRAGGATPLLQKQSASSLTLDDVPEKPNPLQLFINIGAKSDLPSFTEHSDHAYFTSPLLQLDYASSLKYNFSPDFLVAENRGEVTAYRLSGKSIEIAADDRFFVNERAEISLDGVDEYTKIPQTKIADHELSEKARDVVKYSRTQYKLFIIASEKASVRALRQVLEAADPFAKEFTILVRPTKLTND